MILLSYLINEIKLCMIWSPWKLEDNCPLYDWSCHSKNIPNNATNW